MSVAIADVSVAFKNVAAGVNRYEIGGLGKGWERDGINNHDYEDI